MSCYLVAVLAIVGGASAASQDTVRVRADGPSIWGANVRLVQELAIGLADGPPEYAFGRIYHAAAEPGGAFYLFDQNDGQIRRYDARGRFAGLIGRKGGGPGEYQSVGGMSVDRNGMLVVFDPASRRITLFRPDGKVHRETRTDRGAFNPMVIDTAGRMYLVVTAGGRMMEGPGVQQQFLRLAPDGSVVDSLLFPKLTDGTPVRNGFALSTSDGMRRNFIESNLVAPYLTGGLLAATTHAYRIVVSNGAGRVTVIERAHEPVRLGGEERAQWLEWADTMRLRGSGPYDVPRVKPPIREIRSDHLGRIWVDVYVGAEKRNVPPTRPGGGKQILYWRERTTYDVFAPTGHYLGRVALPQESVLLTISGNRLYTRAKGPDEEDRVVVFRIAVPDRP